MMIEMKKLYFISLTLISIFIGCKEPNQQSKSKIQLKYKIIPEDFENKWYSVDWTDTLGLSEGYLKDNFFKRPKEIWCFVTNEKNDTLGYYHGLSTPQSFCYFQAIDSIVTFNFMVGLNIFPYKFENDTTGAKAYWEANKTPIVFEPIKVNLKTDLRKEIEVELNEK